MNRVVIGLVAVFASFALLHGGKTDSNGGHYDRSAGEYHYHHGYSGHDHYDMDGDGDIDCPYTFKDNTKRSSSTIETETYIDPKDYDSFTEWSNAKHGKTETDDFSSNYYNELEKLTKEEESRKAKQFERDYMQYFDEYIKNNDEDAANGTMKTIAACLLLVIFLEVIYLVISKYNRRK